MGLDMYSITLNRTPEQSVDFAAEDAAHIRYWRKHPNLHGWMERLYRSKGGTAPEFNCATLLLTGEDLDALEEARSHLRSVKVRVTNPSTGRFALAQPADWGPHESGLPPEKWSSMK
ncbi:hypothetical protein [Xanthobacter versatilis]|uniref:hypothetical protein n=1 Tax=Xanthobacter autotrophicus (strain ATCC BAA-1158 / Py2) TaxID=78245 RepID=UPI003726A509